MEATPLVRAGNSDAITRAFYDSWLVQQRLLDAVFPTTGITLFGHKLQTPIMTAAVSRLDENFENGITAMAQGVCAAGSMMWMGIGEDDEFEKLAATGVPCVKIIKPYEDNSEILRQIAFAKACGAAAVGVDVDHCFSKDGGASSLRSGERAVPKTTGEIAQFVKAAGDTPFVVKGVLSVQDAVKSAEAGAGAIVVSHHHAIVDFAVPPARLLPEIRAAVGERLAIIADCGIVSGAEAFKALALGADAVCVGRSLLGPLKKEGAAGVEAFLRGMTGELAHFLARTGSPSPAEIDPSVLVKRV